MNARSPAPTRDPELAAAVDALAAIPGVRAVLLVGSASREFRDAWSDVDLEVVVTDGTGPSELPDLGPPFDVHVVPWSDFCARRRSPSDIDHWPYLHCQVLHDGDGRVTEEVARLGAALPPPAREQRIALHYFEFLFHATHLGRTAARGDELSTRLTAGTAVLCLVRLLAVLAGRVPPPSHWAAPDLLEALALPQHVESLAEQLLSSPSERSAQALTRAVDDLLLEQGVDLPLGKQALTHAVTGPDFREARERYGIL